MNYVIKRIWVHKSKKAEEQLKRFLYINGIRLEDTTDYTVGIYEAEQLIATGSLFENIAKCIAIDAQHQGGSVFNMLISHLIDEIYARNYSSCYVYTKPDSVSGFLHLGFKEIARVDDQLVFLEKASGGFSTYLSNLEAQKVTADKIATIVMNANPFTKGHQYLIEYAAKENDILHVFVLSENLSAFPTQIRLALVKAGTAHLNNVIVHETGDYMVSAKTFPSYFLTEDTDITSLQAKLDAIIFKQIAKVLAITHRYVGEEPYSIATALYNEAMLEVFKGVIELTIIPRKEYSGQVISASRVRQLLVENKLEDTKNIVPTTTFDFLNSEEGQKIAQKLRNNIDH